MCRGDFPEVIEGSVLGLSITQSQ